MKPIPYRRIWSITLIPLATGTLASVLFLLQGGFGAGHGRYDNGLLLLGLPSILVEAPSRVISEFLIDHTRWSEYTVFDFVIVVLVPALLNLLFFWVPLAYLLSWLEVWRRMRAGGPGKRGLPEV